MPTAVDSPVAPPADPLAFKALTYKLAIRYRQRGAAACLSVDDLAAEGMLAVVQQLPHHDPSRGPLLGFLAHRIQWAIWQALRAARPWPGLPTNQDGEVVEPPSQEPTEPG